MAHEVERLEKLALKVIAEHNLVFINEVASYMQIGRATFYLHELDKLNSIKDALEQNRINVKKGLRKKWYESDNATTQIALYRLTSTDEELSKLNSQKIDIAADVTLNTVDGFKIVIDDPSSEDAPEAGSSPGDAYRNKT